MNKDESILALLQHLELEHRDWIVVDHWDSDRTAIGIARRDAPRRLVYISTFEKQPGRFFFERETPAGLNETEFTTSTPVEDGSLEELIAALESHLNRP